MSTFPSSVASSLSQRHIPSGAVVRVPAWSLFKISSVRSLVTRRRPKPARGGQCNFGKRASAIANIGSTAGVTIWLKLVL